MRSYDPKEGKYKDQSIGDTPKIYSINIDGVTTKVVGAGCKNGGFYVLNAETGKLLNTTRSTPASPRYPLATNS